MNRLEKYCSLLEHIYGERIVDSFTTRNEKNSSLTMNNEYDNQISRKGYERKENDGCITCKSIFRNPNFSKRILEFPGWIEYLDFSGTKPAKEIMIIGEAPTTLKDQINITFGLGFYPIDNDGNLNFDQLKEIYSGEKIQLKAILKSVRPNRLWEYLNLLFLKKLDIIKPKIYITDLCKCNDDIVRDGNLNKNQSMWTKCLTECLIKEIELINPSLIIFQGGSPYKEVRSYLKDQGIIRSIINTEKDFPKLGDPNFYDKNYSKPDFGKFPFNGKDIYFFKIYHQAAFNRYLKISDRNNYISQNLRFIEKKILKEVLNII